MVRDGVIDDELWDVLEAVLPTNNGRRGRPWNDHRKILEGIIWWFRTGSPWRDLPVESGAYQSVWQRHRLWSTDGTYEAVVAAVHAHAGLELEGLEAVLSIDSTSVRAHQHAAGARHDSVVTVPEGDTGGSIGLHEFSDRGWGAA